MDHLMDIKNGDLLYKEQIVVSFYIAVRVCHEKYSQNILTLLYKKKNIELRALVNHQDPFDVPNMVDVNWGIGKSAQGYQLYARIDLSDGTTIYITEEDDVRDYYLDIEGEGNRYKRNYKVGFSLSLSSVVERYFEKRQIMAAIKVRSMYMGGKKIPDKAGLIIVNPLGSVYSKSFDPFKEI